MQLPEGTRLVVPESPASDGGPFHATGKLQLKNDVEKDDQAASAAGEGPKVLLVDDNDNDLFLTKRSLEKQNCDVVAASSVPEALGQIATQHFDVLLTDLNMPDVGDGFALVTAMHHTQPEALTIVASDFPDVKRAMDAVALQADEVVLKPFDAAQLDNLIDGKVSSTSSQKPAKERVADILDRDLDLLVQRWLARVAQVKELAALRLSTSERIAYLPNFIKNITARLRAIREKEIHIPGTTAMAHGQRRFRQGYAISLLVEESRILQLSIFDTIECNLEAVDFSEVLHDVMIIADEMHAQLQQALDSFLTVQREQASSISV